jgi:glutaminyl-tRNA synthetase
MAILRPLKVTLTNFPAGQVEWLDAPYWPRDIDKEGSRQVPLTGTIYIEQTDFSENPPADWTRFQPGGEVRLRNAYFIRCDEVIRDAAGAVVELRCTYDPDSLGKTAGAGRKHSAALQWVAAAHAVPAEVRLYGRLFIVANPEETEDGKTFKDHLNSRSVQILTGALVEPSLAATQAGERFQFVRHGYFVADSEDSRPGALVFNRIIELPDTYGKQLEGRGPRGQGRAGQPGQAVEQGTGPATEKPAVGSVSEARVQARAENAQLAERYSYYMDALGLSAEQADVLTGDLEVADFFDIAVSTHDNPKAIANWVGNEVLRELKGRAIHDLPFSGVEVGELVRLVDDQVITSAGAKNVFAALLAGEGTPAAIVKRLGLDQKLPADELGRIVDQVLASMPAKVAEYRAGKTSLLGMFTGQVLKATGGKVSPQVAQEIIKAKLA